MLKHRFVTSVLLWKVTFHSHAVIFRIYFLQHESALVERRGKRLTYRHIITQTQTQHSDHGELLACAANLISQINYKRCGVVCKQWIKQTALRWKWTEGRLRTHRPHRSRHYLESSTTLILFTGSIRASCCGVNSVKGFELRTRNARQFFCSFWPLCYRSLPNMIIKVRCMPFMEMGWVLITPCRYENDLYM